MGKSTRNIRNDSEMMNKGYFPLPSLKVRVPKKVPQSGEVADPSSCVLPGEGVVLVAHIGDLTASPQWKLKGLDPIFLRAGYDGNRYATMIYTVYMYYYYGNPNNKTIGQSIGIKMLKSAARCTDRQWPSLSAGHVTVPFSTR